MAGLAGKIDLALSKDFGSIYSSNTTWTSRNVLGDTMSDHGTPVANIIAGAQDGTATEGYAPLAKIAVLRVDDKMPDGTDSIDSFKVANAIDYANTKGIKVLNMSLIPGDTTIDPSLVGAMNNYATGTKGLVVNSAGNQSLANVANGINVTDQNKLSWLFVVALSAPTTTATGYTLATYSDAAGTSTLPTRKSGPPSARSSHAERPKS